MTTPHAALGLCSTCRHGEVCARRPGFSPPVLCCEEFELAPAEAARPRRTAGPEKQPDRAPELLPDNGRQGLCRNCINAPTCALSALPGGVWHCEEYA